MAKNSRQVGLGPVYRRILWPTDFSDFAKAALPLVLRLAAASEAALVILHVLSRAELDVFPGITGRIWDRLAREGRERCQAQLALLAEQAQRMGVQVRTVLAEGVPFQEIVRVATRLRCDVIVLATHGRTGLRHVLIGSVAEKVVRWSPCPVLTVRPPGVAPRD